jgi:hypothetical protein
VKIPNVTTLLVYTGAGAAVVALGYVLVRKAQGDNRTFTEIIAEGVARSAVTAAEGAAVGTVKGIGAAVGIPDTNATQCTAAKAAGNVLDASKYCKAADFLTWSANRVLGRDRPADDARPTLRMGSTGDAVKTLQRRLGVGVDGVFGDATLRAVIVFQTSVNLIADGIVGPQTWAALDAGFAVVDQDGMLISGSNRDLIR